jgi:hypothetical protein
MARVAVGPVIVYDILSKGSRFSIVRGQSFGFGVREMGSAMTEEEWGQEEEENLVVFVRFPRFIE